jgi:hypothetical protein
MTTIEKIARRKLSLLQIAQDLANVSRACKVMGYSRQQFYEIRRELPARGFSYLEHVRKDGRPPRLGLLGAGLHTMRRGLIGYGFPAARLYRST